ncbi:phosphosulfolactate synthase [Alphaproteobacteria bacterium]|nr:phosphosulfolactate synthase [Alphaproteobacteria bacterium]
MDKAFPFVQLDERRSQTKPRITGLTLVKDYQTGLEALEDTLAVVADYVDIFKFVTGTTRLLNRDFVKEKTALLRKHQIQPYLGGQFQEYVLHTMGVDAFPQHLEEAKELGFEIVEVSDNVVPLPDGVRKNLVDQIRDLGMIPVVEVGDKKVNSSAEGVVNDVLQTLEEGSAFAMIEAQELMIGSEPNAELIHLLKAKVDVGRCMFEVSSPYVGSTLPEIHVGKKFLLKTFGPDVNLGNILLVDVIETEAGRVGLAAAGPLSFQ